VKKNGNKALHMFSDQGRPASEGPKRAKTESGKSGHLDFQLGG